MGWIALCRGVCATNTSITACGPQGTLGGCCMWVWGKLPLAAAHIIFPHFHFLPWDKIFLSILFGLLFLLLWCVLLFTSQLSQFSLYLFLWTQRIFFAVGPEDQLLLLAYDQALLNFPRKPTGSDAKLSGIASSFLVPWLCWYQQLLQRSRTPPTYSSACCSGSDESSSLLLYYWYGFQQLWTKSCRSQQVAIGFIRTVMVDLTGISISCINSASYY